MRHSQGRTTKIARPQRCNHMAAFGLMTKLGPALNAAWYLRGVTSRGRRVTLRGRPSVVNQGTIRLGERVRLVSTIATLELVTLPGGQLEIGNNAFVNFG